MSKYLKILFWGLSVIILIPFLVSCTLGFAQVNFTFDTVSYIDKNLKDSVVIVKHPKGGFGSGFFIDKGGYLISNYHVAKPFLQDGTKPIIVMYSGKRYRAEILAIDKKNDLSLMKINAYVINYLKLDKDDDFKVGDVGTSLGHGRSKYWNSKELTYIIYDTSSTWEYRLSKGVVPGDSGGPLLDDDNEVIGVVSGRMRKNWNTLEWGYSCAVPVNDVKLFLNREGYGRLY